jgi:hypothetical protein
VARLDSSAAALAVGTCAGRRSCAAAESQQRAYWAHPPSPRPSPAAPVPAPAPARCRQL